ncbi:MAG: T9SS type A sorting domain-containing protein [Saprospiraceae bacterium]|nr:T9SS type A sorting domain-containing protein [Saprospiraceae bacterium]
MKKILLLLSILWMGHTALLAQLPNGTVAPNFTVVDVNGQSHSLYALLDQGKTVYLDFFATWCVPCWNYHNSGALEGMWEEYGPPGTNEAYVMAIESDPSTTIPCITGLPSCSGGTVGDWTAGTPYPIADAAGVAGQYAISYYPTIMMVCPADRKVYEPGQLPTASLWSYRNQTCPPLVVNTAVNQVENVTCIGSNTGDIDISVSGGSAPFTYTWSNGQHTQDLHNIPAGTYTCTVTNAQGWMGITDPITVEAPSEPLDVAVVEVIEVGCNGLTGTATVEGVGGWSGGYSYTWSNGQGGPIAAGLSVGTFTVTVTDDNTCTKTKSIVMAPPVMPQVSVATPGNVTCLNPTITLSASATGNGGFTYQWYANNGGNITSGATSATPTVNAGGTYVVQITNATTTCAGFGSAIVAANTTQPTANAGPSMTVTCSAPTVNLAGSGPSGANYSYLWTASNGGTISSGANTLTPTVGASGTYTLNITDSSNGCSASSSTTVTGNNVSPTAEAAGGSLTCVLNAVNLGVTTNATTPSFAWSGPNGYSSTEQNPVVATAGEYVVSVLDPTTGCVNVDTAIVGLNTAAPGATATGGTLTCAVSSITLGGSTPGTGAAYLWTGPNGFTSAEQNPSVASTGEYSLQVTSTANGCTSVATTTVDQNTTAPTSSAATPGNLNCQNAELQLSGSGSSEGANFSYAWTTTNGNIVMGANTLSPTVNAVGEYTLLVSNTENGCSSSVATTVAQSVAVEAAVNSQTNVSCNGGANGTAAVTPAGGNATYAFVWSNGETTQSISNLAAGTYGVTVTDGENCSAATAVTISEPAILAANASATSQTAAGVNDGTATASPAGGTSGYTYLWDNNETTQTISGLAPGTYMVVVTDANGCSVTQNVTVNAFDCALTGGISGTNVTCFGVANGTAIVAQAGGNDPLTYTWSNGGSTPSVENLAPGTYTVEVKDVTNCAVILNISISEPSLLSTMTTVSAETAAGANDGTASASPNGGVANYTYLWSNGETTASITGLTPNAYTVTVTDANGCMDVETVVVNSYNCIITAGTSITNIACFGQANGSVSLAITGGTEPFTYLWSNGETTASISNLSPGAYTATITDANGCQLNAEGAVTEPEALDASSVTVNPVCANDPSGVIDVTATGGTEPYAFVWSNGLNTGSVSGLSPGSYTVTLTDANGCAINNSFTLAATDQEAPVIAAQNTSLSLSASGNATATLQSLGAVVSDNCSVSNSTISPNSFDCSQVGSHEVTIWATDDAGNVSSSTITVTVVDDIAPTVSCPANIVSCWYENTINYGAPVAVDNCLSNSGNWNQTEGLPSGSVFPVGTTAQTYTYKDASGNIGSCTFSVIITEPILVAVSGVTNDVNNQGNGAIDITVGGGSQPYSYVWTRENQVVGTTEDLTGLTEGTYVVNVKDANGCLVAIEGIVVGNTTSAVEPIWLRGVSIRPNPTTGLTQVVLSNLPASTLEISVLDAMGREVLRQLSDQQVVIRLDCSLLPDGVYLVRFRTGHEVGARKLVVSH